MHLVLAAQKCTRLYSHSSCRIIDCKTCNGFPAEVKDRRQEGSLMAVGSPIPDYCHRRYSDRAFTRHSAYQQHSEGRINE